MKRRDITGIKINKLTAIKRLERPDAHNSYWEFVCDCGNTTTGILHNFLKGTWVSCGCSQYPKGSGSKNWKGIGDMGAAFVTKIKTQAKRRGIEFDLEIKYLWELFLEQNRECALTGLSLMFPSSAYGLSHGEGTASLDRINSNIGYVKSNVQWVHKDVNRMKQQFDQEYFIKLCAKVYKERGCG